MDLENEIWKDVINYEGLYQVSNLGRVRSVGRTYKTGLGVLRTTEDSILSLTINNSGYYCLTLFKDKKLKSKLVHRLVWEAFNGATYLKVLHNVEGNKLDCRLSNLHIGTVRLNNSEYRLSTKKTSKFIGVSFIKNRNKWKASIFFNKKPFWLGEFKEELEAAKAYQISLNTINIYETYK